MAESLENREIPGLTVKGLIWFFSGVIAVIITVMGSAFSIKSDVQAVRSDMSKISDKVEGLQQSAILRDAKIETLQVQFQTIQLQLARLQEQVGHKQ